jgi:hypothetical protein
MQVTVQDRYNRIIGRIYSNVALRGGNIYYKLPNGYTVATKYVFGGGHYDLKDRFGNTISRQ